MPGVDQGWAGKVREGQKPPAPKAAPKPKKTAPKKKG